MASGLVIAWMVTQIVRRVFKFRQKIVGLVQDFLGSILFAGFIDKAAQRWDLIPHHMRLMDMGIKAYIFIVPLPVLVARYHYEIKADPTLYGYFSQFPAVREHFGLIEQNVIYTHSQIEKELIQDLSMLSSNPQYIRDKEDDIMKDIRVFFQAWSDTLWQLWQTCREDPLTFCEILTQKLTQVRYPSVLYHMNEWIAMSLNPCLCFDWATIASCIHSYDAYNKVATQLEWLEVPQAYIPRMRVRLAIPEGVAAEGAVYQNGHFSLKTKEPVASLEALKVSLHDLGLPIQHLDYLLKFSYVVNWSGEKFLFTDPVKASYKSHYFGNWDHSLLLFLRLIPEGLDRDQHWGCFAMRAWERQDAYVVEVFCVLTGNAGELHLTGYGKVCDIPYRYLPDVQLINVTNDYLVGKIYLDKETKEITEVKIDQNLPLEYP